MNNAEFQLRGVGDPRLAVHATSALPAWLWSIDGTRVLWANPVGARLLGADNGAALAKRIFGPADAHRRQVAQLAGRLPSNDAIRLQRLRGFGAPLGMLVTCGCARLEFADGSQGILLAAAEMVGRSMPLIERLQRLVEGIEPPIAAFARDGEFVGASDAARPLLGFRSLAEAGLDDARSDALKQGRVEARIGVHHMVLQRVGSGADVGLVALIAPGATDCERAPQRVAPAAEQPIPDYEQPASSGEAPAEFALIDEFAESPPAETAEAAPPEAAQQPIAPAAEQPIPDYEQPASSGEAPAEFALIDEFVESPPAETPVDLASQTEAPPETTTPEIDVHQDEPSPYVEAVADEPAPLATEPPPAIDSAPPSGAPQRAEMPPWLDQLSPAMRRHPLRFAWQMDVEGRFSLGSDEFTRLIGARTATSFGRLWSEIAEVFGLDPHGRVANAVATRDTWGGITLHWPVDGGGRLPVELSGLPIYDRLRNFAGYRGFGVCRDFDGLARLAALRRYEFVSDPPTPQTLSADIVRADPANGAAAAELPAEPDAASSSTPEWPASIACETSPQTDLETSVEPPKNVVPFRSPGDTKSPVLTPVENTAFNELARQLSARLEGHNGTAVATPGDAPEAVLEHPAAPETPGSASATPEWLAQPEPPARGETRRDKTLLDLLPVGVLIYRLDRLLYANPAFLARMGYPSLHALEEAGGLDALYVEPGVSTASSTSGTGTPVTISASQASPEDTPSPGIDAHLFTISWDDDSALALIFSDTGTKSADLAAAIAEPAPAPEPSAVGHANAEELGAILDTAVEGIVMFDAEGNLNSCNRSAEALFGYDGDELVQRNLTELFAPESQPAVLDYLESIKGSGVASLLDHGREVLGRASRGGLIPLSVTMGRTRPDGPNFFAVFRDLSQTKKSESELQQARRLADRAANGKADMLARISHEVRTPLNAIIGFAEVMIDERFGALGNERHVEYMKDIRASGERVIAIINDLLDLSRIETGKLELAFASQNLNEVVEQCVAVMQPQANRERIIIRTSLAHALPPVLADGRALRQIALNLIGNSIHLANAGGQVIVSTALSDFGEVVLRVRDTGHGLNDNEVAAALEPFRTQAPSDQASDSSGVSLSLIKALVEANRARFHIKTGAHSGTLIEVVFLRAMARA
ncbi:PAS domain-containing sensor histidine kinase [Bradyrhizobium sp. URHD0069]|uniref:PAS domain-containing sensor histidine kinase n=1 Tax=Bradyrhizobium sp. URHD0069 TaxID=1380355 RepID=UPI000496D62A|nr:PAS domain-containing sensor histidine kinase [Bradyrhizobium sp. URHD0069]